MVSPKGPQPASAEGRLAELGIELPPAPTPLGAYVEGVRTGSLLYLSGVLPVAGGRRSSQAGWVVNTTLNGDAKPHASRR